MGLDFSIWVSKMLLIEWDSKYDSTPINNNGGMKRKENSKSHERF
jgi:hypothetical protein